MGIETIIEEFANVGTTIMVCMLAIILVRGIDEKINKK